MPKRKQEMQFRYYEMPEDSFVLSLTGQSWVRKYGDGIASLHFHNYLEIGVCYEGTGEMIYDEQVFQFKPGCYTIIPPNYPHTTNSTPGTYGFWEYLFVDCEGIMNRIYPKKKETMNRALQLLYQKAYFFQPGEMPTLRENIDHVFKERKEKRDFYKQESDGYLALILIDVIRMAAAELHEETPQAHGDLDRILPALNYIHEHFREEVYIQKLAEVCALSETHFRRIFTESMHLSPLDYLNSVRIHNACIELRSSKKTIRSVAFDNGFTSISTFQRNFHKFVGMSTNEWRFDPKNYEYKLNNFKINTYEGW